MIRPIWPEICDQPGAGPARPPKKNGGQPVSPRTILVAVGDPPTVRHHTKPFHSDAR